MVKPIFAEVCGGINCFQLSFCLEERRQLSLLEEFISNCESQFTLKASTESELQMKVVRRLKWGPDVQRSNFEKFETSAWSTEVVGSIPITFCQLPAVPVGSLSMPSDVSPALGGSTTPTWRVSRFSWWKQFSIREKCICLKPKIVGVTQSTADGARLRKESKLRCLVFFLGSKISFLSSKPFIKDFFRSLLRVNFSNQDLTM